MSVPRIARKCPSNVYMLISPYTYMYQNGGYRSGTDIEKRMLPELLYPEHLQLTFQETVLLPFGGYLHFPTSILPATKVMRKMKDIRAKLNIW